MIQRIKARLDNKHGASLIWAVFILLMSIMVLMGVYQVSSTYGLLSEAKSEIEDAGIAALQYNYIESTKGIWRANLSAADIKSHLETDSNLESSGSAERKLNANGTELFTISDLSVASKQNYGVKASVENGYAISCTVSHPIYFGGVYVLDVPISVTVYVWYAPKAF